ncbi:MAG: hypothetical protein ACLFS7_01425 [Desulfosudaceae bacterium]
MNKKNRIVFCCYLIVLVGLTVAGFIYLFRDEFMPYHSVAVGLPWAEVPAPFKLLILALMKVVGGAWLVIALALLIILLGPFRRGAGWTRWALPVLLTATYAGMSNAMSLVTINTPAMPPWSFVMASLALILVAVLFSILPGKA